ncbi:hypothetical protein HUU40_12770 [candidate division KSB1 bacterium]|nr:hypothetical protein [candidate division KSB1 bacterium]
MWKIFFLLLFLFFAFTAIAFFRKGRRGSQFTVFAAIAAGVFFVYFYALFSFGLERQDTEKTLPLIFLVALIAVVVYATIKKKESIAGVSSIAILGVAGTLYYMIVFLDYEILGTYTLKSLKRHKDEILAAKTDLDSLRTFRRQVLKEIEATKKEIETSKSAMDVQFEKIPIYTAEAARTNLEMKAHLARQSEIENTIQGFDKKLALITQNQIKFAFLIGDKPLVVGGGIVDEFRNDLIGITDSLGKQLGFDSDSLMLAIKNRSVELERQFNERQEDLQKSRKD